MRKTAPDPTLVILRFGFGILEPFCFVPEIDPRKGGTECRACIQFYLFFCLTRLSLLHPRSIDFSTLTFGRSLLSRFSSISLSNTCNCPCCGAMFSSKVASCLATDWTLVCEILARKIMNVPFFFFHWSRTFIFIQIKWKNGGGNDNSIQGRISFKVTEYFQFFYLVGSFTSWRDNDHVHIV